MMHAKNAGRMSVVGIAQRHTVRIAGSFPYLMMCALTFGRACDRGTTKRSKAQAYSLISVGGYRCAYCGGPLMTVDLEYRVAVA